MSVNTLIDRDSILIESSLVSAQADLESDQKTESTDPNFPKTVTLDCSHIPSLRSFKGPLDITKFVSAELILNKWRYGVPYLLGIISSTFKKKVKFELFDGMKLKDKVNANKQHYAFTDMSFSQLEKGEACFQYFGEYTFDFSVKLYDPLIQNPTSFFEAYFRANQFDHASLYTIGNHFVREHPAKAIPYFQLYASRTTTPIERVNRIALHCGEISGTLQQDGASEWVYVRVNQCYLDIFSSFACAKGFKIPIFAKGPYVTVIPNEESRKFSVKLEKPQNITFSFGNFCVVMPKKWPGVKKEAVMTVHSDGFKSFRAQHNLSPQLSGNGFLMTIGLEQEEEQKESNQSLLPSSPSSCVEETECKPLISAAIGVYQHEIPSFILQEPKSGLVYVPINIDFIKKYLDLLRKFSYLPPDDWNKRGIGPYIAVVFPSELQNIHFEFPKTIELKYKFQAFDFIDDKAGKLATIYVQSKELTNLRKKHGLGSIEVFYLVIGVKQG